MIVVNIFNQIYHSNNINNKMDLNVVTNMLMHINLDKSENTSVMYLTIR